MLYLLTDSFDIVKNYFLKNLIFTCFIKVKIDKKIGNNVFKVIAKINVFPFAKCKWLVVLEQSVPRHFSLPRPGLTFSCLSKIHPTLLYRLLLAVFSHLQYMPCIWLTLSRYNKHSGLGVGGGGGQGWRVRVIE